MENAFVWMLLGIPAVAGAVACLCERVAGSGAGHLSGAVRSKRARLPGTSNRE